MKLITHMPATLQPYFLAELHAYAHHFEAKHFPQAWLHLERAHVIGQAYPYQHSVVHAKMLAFGIKIKSVKEVLGQIPRLFVGGVKSFVGKIPVGNTGGANIPPFKSLPISSDIKEIFRKAGVVYG